MLNMQFNTEADRMRSDSDLMENATSLLSENTTLTPNHLSKDVNLYGGSSVTVVISEVAIRNIYVSIGSVGFVGNLLVIFILTLYTNVTEKVNLVLSCCSVLVFSLSDLLAISRITKPSFTWVYLSSYLSNENI